MNLRINGYTPNPKQSITSLISKLLHLNLRDKIWKNCSFFGGLDIFQRDLVKKIENNPNDPVIRLIERLDRARQVDGRLEPEYQNLLRSKLEAQVRRNHLLFSHILTDEFKKYGIEQEMDKLNIEEEKMIRQEEERIREKKEKEDEKKLFLFLLESQFDDFYGWDLEEQNDFLLQEDEEEEEFHSIRLIHEEPNVLIYNLVQLGMGTESLGSPFIHETYANLLAGVHYVFIYCFIELAMGTESLRNPFLHEMYAKLSMYMLGRVVDLHSNFLLEIQEIEKREPETFLDFFMGTLKYYWYTDSQLIIEAMADALDGKFEGNVDDFIPNEWSELFNDRMFWTEWTLRKKIDKMKEDYIKKNQEA